jgi:histidinol phosphatase-like PHP family hydrolase
MIDIHNHTQWSDGINTPEEIIENAIDFGIDVIGISDHYNTSKCHSVEPETLASYIFEMKRLKEKYKDAITLLSGIEICMHKQLSDVNSLDYDKLNNLDYVLFEYIDYMDGYMIPDKNCVRLKDIWDFRKNIKVKAGLAHTDLLALSKYYSNGRNITSGIEYVTGLIKENNIFWEINVNPGYGYFDYMFENRSRKNVKSLFKAIKEKNIEITVGSDIHDLCYFEMERVEVGNDMALFEVPQVRRLEKPWFF